ncbi:MAG: S8 family serine peptidase, partial [Chloroflexi bacterium]|nr:S8 family serine peptidase [Chloroflexota bacterium]
ATSTGVGGGTITYMGTSQASPHAAGVAALLFQAFPDLTVNELEARMKATGKLLTDDLDDGDPSTNRTTPRVDARVALLDPDDDADGDGCSNGEEFGSDPRFGGQRNPLNPWDFHDVNGDGIITLFDDILAVINGFGTGGNDPLLDRSPAPAAGQPWQQGPPDGTIDIPNDILGIASQFGHRCVGAP